jgi:hypothetical protein
VHHIIPKSLHKSPHLDGLNLDQATNAIPLRTGKDSEIRMGSTHRGPHKNYNQAISEVIAHLHQQGHDKREIHHAVMSAGERLLKGGHLTLDLKDHPDEIKKHFMKTIGDSYHFTPPGDGN